MRKSRFTEPQIMAVLRQAESGVAVPELCREHGNLRDFVAVLAAVSEGHDTVLRVNLLLSV